MATQRTEQQDENWNGNENEDDNKLNIFIFITIFGHNLTHLPYSRRRLSSKCVCSGFVRPALFIVYFRERKREKKINMKIDVIWKGNEKANSETLSVERLTTTDKR